MSPHNPASLYIISYMHCFFGKMTSRAFQSPDLIYLFECLVMPLKAPDLIHQSHSIKNQVNMGKLLR